MIQKISTIMLERDMLTTIIHFHGDLKDYARKSK